MKRLKAFFTLTILILSVGVAFGQKDSEKKLKVGLVLSGGGAKGFAHIGALKVIDSLGIQIDYVAGSSMGGIIGALYASGYSGKQLESIFEELNFEELIADYIPRGDKTLFEKAQGERYILNLPFDHFKLTLPSGLTPGQNVHNLFTRMTLHVAHIEDFSHLPIPYFCTATDAETGESLILENGSLVQSMRATGALPSLFQPVFIDNRMLIDGGVKNNYPIDELIAKGMDSVIGVDVQDSLRNREQLKSAPEILLQINNYRTIKDMRRKSEITDVYIKPLVKDFTVVSFDRGKEIIDEGGRAALQKLSQLQQLAQAQKGKVKAKRDIPMVDSLTITSVSIDGSKNYTRAYFLGKLKIKQGEKMSYEKFVRGVNSLVATDNFDSFSYQLKPDGQHYQLHCWVRESEVNTHFKTGIHYDGLYKTGALFNLTRKRNLTKNDLLSIDIVVGDNIRYDFKYFIDKGFYWSIGLNSRYVSFEKGVDASLVFTKEKREELALNKIGIEFKDWTNQVYLQTLFRKDFSLQLGVEHKRIKIDSETFIEKTDLEKAVLSKDDYYGVFGKLKYDSYNHRHFPTQGVYFDGRFNLYLNSSDKKDGAELFSIAKADLGAAIKILPKSALKLSVSGGFKIGENLASPFRFALGGYGNTFPNNFIPFYGYDFISLAGDSFVKGGIDFDLHLFKKSHLIISANYANIGDNIFDNGEWITAPDYSGYAIGYSLESFLGPISLKYSISPEMKSGFWLFNLGFWFWLVKFRSPGVWWKLAF